MMESDEGILLEVSVPENATPLSTVTVQAPDGRFFEIVLPDRVEPGDVITVLIPTATEVKTSSTPVVSSEQFDVSDDIPNAKNATSMTYSKAAALTAGVVVGTLVVGPILTGIAVVGGVIAVKSINKRREQTGSAHEVDDISEENPPAEPTIFDKFNSRAKEIDEKNKISETVNKVGQQVTVATGKLLQSAKELDEKNKISETVITSVTDFDQKYEISATASRAVNAGITRAKDFDNEHKVSEKVSEAGAQAVAAAKEFDQKYEVSATLSKTFSSGVASFASWMGEDKKPASGGGGGNSNSSSSGNI